MSTLKVLLLVANWLHVGRDDEREYVSTPYSLPPTPPSGKVCRQIQTLPDIRSLARLAVGL